MEGQNFQNSYFIRNHKFFISIEPENRIKHRYTIFFFCGFTMHPNFYVSQFFNFIKNYTEKTRVYFKIILPVPNKYLKETFTYFRPFNKSLIKTKFIYSWFNYQLENENCSKYLTEYQKDDFIKNLILQEISLIGGGEQIIFIGHSMGGRYILHLLDEMKMKTKLNVLFKSYIFLYKNRKDDFYLNLKNYSDVKNDNIIYSYFSKRDPIADLSQAEKSFKLLKIEFSNVLTHLDESDTHMFDDKCFKYLEELFDKEINIFS
jgi:hypothetical protein